MALNEPIIIIGGGVIGLSIGWHLARQGQAVLLFEKDQAGSGASGAAAGMITPASEIRFGEEALSSLFLESLFLYPRFVEELEHASGQKVDFHSTGSLTVAIDRDDEAELMRLYDYQKKLGLPVRLLSPQKIQEREPHLSVHVHAGIEAASECFLDNRLLVAALKKAFIKAGGKLIEGKKVSSLTLENQRVTGVTVDGETLQTSKIVLASGLENDLDGLPPPLRMPLRPIKGQALEVRFKGPPPLQRAVRTIHRYPVYLVPRSDGRMILGATSEEMGHDRRVTAGALLDLLAGAWKILPSLEDAEFIGAWTGLRAATPDHAPILGPTDVDGLYLALGFYRHGILLTPLVGQLLSESLLRKYASPYFTTFGWKRFA